MECADCSWFQFWLGIGIGAAVTLVVSLFALWLIKNPYKPKIEKIFKKNTEFIDEQYFGHVSRIDSYKKRIYEQLITNPEFNPDKPGGYQYPQQIYNEIFRYRGLISNEIEIIQGFKKLSGDIDLQHLLKVQQYTITAYIFIGEIRNRENSLFYDPKVLERHRYYAKQIIESFGKTASNFQSQWKQEFSRVGGILNVKFPTLEPGDIVGFDLNMNNELLFWDPQFSNLLKTIQDVKSSNPRDSRS